MQRDRLHTAADDHEPIRSRLQFEWRFGHHLAAEPAALEAARRMTMACGCYLRSRVHHDAKSSGYRVRLTYELLSKLMQPAPLPFALHAGSPYAGRPRNVKELQEILDGNGNIRELLGTVWLFFSVLIGADLVGKRLHPDALEIAQQAGFDETLLRHWLQQAMHYRRMTHESASLPDLDPKRDFLRMPWHPVFELNRQSHTLRSSPQCNRVWSLDTREEFLRTGGTFSRIEQERLSPLGKARVPWIDPARFTSINRENELVRHALVHRMPMRTGISRVGMQMMQFARVTRSGNAAVMRRAVLGYLLSVRAHSFFEGVIGTADNPVRPPCSYQDCALLDWERVSSSCGPVPEPWMPDRLASPVRSTVTA